MCEVKKKFGKPTYEEVAKYFEEKGCILLSKEYKNMDIKLEFKCTCGENYIKSFKNFKASPYCKECSIKNKKKPAKIKKYSFEEVKQYFKDNDCLLLEDEYLTVNTKMKYQCSCGNVSEITFALFRSGSRCKKCVGDRRSNPQKYLIEEIEIIFSNEGCKLLSNTYIDNETKLQFLCKCGRNGEKRLSEFFRFSACKKCGKESMAEKQSLEFEYVYNYFIEHGCVLLEEEYINNRTPMKYLCKCEKESVIRFDAFKKGNRCKECGLIKQASNNQRENHYNWNPNKTDEEREEKRITLEYRQWRLECLRRDWFKCLCCGGKDKIVVHHKDGYHWCTERRLDSSNGVTLCTQCHTKFHFIFGQKNNTESQFKDFKNNKLYINKEERSA